MAFMEKPLLIFSNELHDSAQQDNVPKLSGKLWIYTNYDCNLSCTYCLAYSTPQALRKALSLADVKRLVDEAQALGFQEVFLTGGEPFILPDIYEMLDYASARLKTNVLTNGMLLKGRRLERLKALKNDQLTIQVSLDGGSAEAHDAYRGQGTWKSTMAAIRCLLDDGFHVRLSTTITPANEKCLDELCALHLSLGIPEQDHVIRPLAKRGFSQAGQIQDMTNLAPEVTVTLDGVFWHPLSTDPDMQVSPEIFPLSEAVRCIREQLERLSREDAPLKPFT
jgi:MoaA/NifB/PqqE/SkfB family radical SAM enzyme